MSFWVLLPSYSLTVIGRAKPERHSSTVTWHALHAPGLLPSQFSRPPPNTLSVLPGRLCPRPPVCNPGLLPLPLGHVRPSKNKCDFTRMCKPYRNTSDLSENMYDLCDVGEICTRRTAESS